jgi:hypothetical protein
VRPRGCGAKIAAHATDHRSPMRSPGVNGTDGRRQTPPPACCVPRVGSYDVRGQRSAAGRAARSSRTWVRNPPRRRGPQSSFRALDGCTRLGSPGCLAKVGGQGASPRPSSSSRRATRAGHRAGPRERRCRPPGRRAARRGQGPCPSAARRARHRPPRPSQAASRRARRARGAPSTRSRPCGRVRSGCSPGRRRRAPPSTTCSSRGRASAFDLAGECERGAAHL